MSCRSAVEIDKINQQKNGHCSTTVGGRDNIFAASFSDKNYIALIKRLEPIDRQDPQAATRRLSEYNILTSQLNLKQLDFSHFSASI